MFGHRSTSTAVYKPGALFSSNTPHNDIVEGFLQRAQTKAEEVRSGESFEIALVDGWPLDVEYMEIVGPIMDRADEYGLIAGPCIDGIFEFTRP